MGLLVPAIWADHPGRLGFPRRAVRAEPQRAGLFGSGQVHPVGTATSLGCHLVSMAISWFIWTGLAR
jgi:hypothetical protein